MRLRIQPMYPALRGSYWTYRTETSTDLFVPPNEMTRWVGFRIFESRL